MKYVPYKINRNLSLEYGKRYKVQFDKKNIAENIINIFNYNLESIPIRHTLLNTKIDGIYWVLLKHQS